MMHYQLTERGIGEPLYNDVVTNLVYAEYARVGVPKRNQRSGRKSMLMKRLRNACETLRVLSSPQRQFGRTNNIRRKHTMKRIKYILATALVALTLGIAQQPTSTLASPPPICYPPDYCGVAEGPIDDTPQTRPGVQASEPLAEGEVETDGRHIPTGTITV
jgi:hypothetical protein